MTRRPRLSLLVPTHSEDRPLRRCLNSVDNQLRDGDEVIVIGDTHDGYQSGHKSNSGPLGIQCRNREGLWIVFGSEVWSGRATPEPTGRCFDVYGIRLIRPYLAPLHERPAPRVYQGLHHPTRSLNV